MEEPLHVTANLLFGTRDRADEFAGAVFFGGGEREVLLELLPVGPFGFVRPELAYRVIRALSKIFVGHRRCRTRAADDPVVLGQQSCDGEMEETR